MKVLSLSPSVSGICKNGALNVLTWARRRAYCGGAVNAMMRLGILSLVTLVSMAQTSPPSQEWRAAINRGVESFKRGRYADAVAAFEQAVALRPEDPVSHLYVRWAQSPGTGPGRPFRRRSFVPCGKRGACRMRR